nr:MAG TPA: Envelope small membrane protein [Bacteriophage sp.]
MDDSFYYLEEMRKANKRGVHYEYSLSERFTTFLLQAFLWIAGIVFSLIFVVPVLLLIWFLISIFS